MSERTKGLMFSQLKKIKTFIFLLLFLFTANIIINLFFEWGGLSPVVRVYVFFFSFLVIFNFSTIDIDEYKDYYIRKYGPTGILNAFFATRVFPFFFIYLVTVVYTFIHRMGREEWFVDTALSLLDGTYSNTVFYALALFVVLKIQKNPGFTIPVFLLSCILFFQLDTVVHDIYEPGPVIAVFKFMKYVVLFAVLIYDFIDDRKRIIRTAAYSLGIAVFMFAGVLGAKTLFYNIGNKGSYMHVKAASRIMNMGFLFPVDSYRKAIIDREDISEIPQLINMSQKLNFKFELTEDVWMKALFEGNNLDVISEYLFDNDIMLPFGDLAAKVEKISKNNPRRLTESRKFIIYYSNYIPDNEDYTFTLYRESDRQTRIFFLRAIAQTGNEKYIDEIIDGLTVIDRDYAVEVYDTLTKITGEDPAEDKGLAINSPEVVYEFRRISRKKGSED